MTTQEQMAALSRLPEMIVGTYTCGMLSETDVKDLPREQRKALAHVRELIETGDPIGRMDRSVDVYAGSRRISVYPDGAVRFEVIGYKSRAARDAQESGYGAKRYWDHLEQSAYEHRDYFARHSELGVDPESMLTRTLSEALAGNDGS